VRKIKHKLDSRGTKERINELFFEKHLKPVEIANKLKVGMPYITKIIQKVTEENQNSYKILQLYLNTLYTLSETDKNPELIISIFKMKILCLLGYTPRITECTICKKKEQFQYFSLKDNGFKCIDCGRPDKSCLTMSESTCNAIKYIVMSPPKKLYSFNLKDESLNELKLIAKLYFNEKVENQY